MHAGHDLGTRSHGTSMQAIRVVPHDIGAEGTQPAQVVVRVGAAQHDSPAEGPGQLGVLNVIAFAVGDHLLETEGLDEEPMSPRASRARKVGQTWAGGKISLMAESLTSAIR